MYTLLIMLSMFDWYMLQKKIVAYVSSDNPFIASFVGCNSFLTIRSIMTYTCHKWSSSFPDVCLHLWIQLCPSGCISTAPPFFDWYQHCSILILAYILDIYLVNSLRAFLTACILDISLSLIFFSSSNCSLLVHVHSRPCRISWIM